MPSLAAQREAADAIFEEAIRIHDWRKAILVRKFAWSLKRKRNRHTRAPEDVTTWDALKYSEAFLFSREDVAQLLRLLGLPATVTTDSMDKSTTEYALCVLLHRLTKGVEWSVTVSLLGSSQARLSRLASHLLSLLFPIAQRKLRGFVGNETREELQAFKNLILEKVLANNASHNTETGWNSDVCALIDGTDVKISRPSATQWKGLNVQREYYTGHKKAHTVKFQAVVAPTGLCLDFFGPVAGSHNDGYVWHKSELARRLERTGQENEDHFLLAGDPAYFSYESVYTGFRRSAHQDLDESQAQFNTALSRVRLPVEWFFGDLKVKYFRFFEKKNFFKLGETAFTHYSFVGVFLLNCFYCLRGTNEACSYFHSKPPTLEEYLSN